MARLLKVPEVAKSLGLSRSKTYELIARGDLGSVRIDGSRRIPADELTRFIEGLKEQGRATRRGALEELAR